MTAITKRRRSEKSSNQSEFRDCFENLPLLAYRIGLDGRIVDCNKLAVRTLGYKSKKELVGKSLITVVYAPSSRENAKKLLAQWRRTGKLRNQELQIITKRFQFWRLVFYKSLILSGLFLNYRSQYIKNSHNAFKLVVVH